MADAITVNPQLAALLSAFAESLGASEPDSRSGAGGLEMSIGALTARLLPHPGGDDRFVIEVDVCSADAASDAPHAALHRLNYAARFQHDWQASIDLDGTLVVYTVRPIASTDPGTLESLVADGFERACALARLWQTLEHTPVEATESLRPMGPLAIRA